MRSPSEQSVFNLSRTCSFFYKILSPYIFRSITLRNTEKSGRAVQYLCSTEQAMTVRTLYFKAEAPGDEDEHFHDVERVFPASVNHILSNLSRLHNLVTLVVDFDFHMDAFDPSYEWGEVLDAAMGDDEDENSEQIAQKESEEGWRALMKNTLRAISENTSDSVQTFIYKGFHIRTNSGLGSESFSKWLGKLDHFELHAYGGDNGACWKLTTAPMFHRYIESLDRHFLDALTNVTHLAIIGHEEASIGQNGGRGALIPLKPDHLPKLKELELGYYLVQDHLIEFLAAHSSTIEVYGILTHDLGFDLLREQRVTFNHCYRFGDSYDEVDSQDSDIYVREPGKQTWGSFFHDYASHSPSALQHVAFKPHNTAILHKDDGLWDFDDVLRTRQVLANSKAEGKGYRVFPYAWIDNKYGMLDEQIDCNRIRAWRGMDMEGWFKLVAVMEANRKRIKGGNGL